MDVVVELTLTVITEQSPYDNISGPPFYKLVNLRNRKESSKTVSISKSFSSVLEGDKEK